MYARRSSGLALYDTCMALQLCMRADWCQLERKPLNAGMGACSVHAATGMHRAKPLRCLLPARRTLEVACM